MIKRAYVEITNVCNLHCSFCPGTRREPGFLAPENFQIMAEKLRTVTEYLYLHVLGEPLLHPQLKEILTIAAGQKFRVCITTNGFLLPARGPELLEADCLHKVSVSLHSFEGNEGGDLNPYLEGVWDFAAKAAEKGILCALRLWNQGGQDRRNGEIFAFLSEKCGKDVAALPVDAAGNRRLMKGLYLEQAEKFDWPDKNGQERGTEFCHALRQQIAVLWDGTVVPCCLDGEGEMALGNLLTEDLSAILTSRRALDMVQGFQRRKPTEELCRKCGYAERFRR